VHIVFGPLNPAGFKVM